MKKPDIAANLIDYIESNILTGVYAPGDRLPPLRNLAHKFGISYSSALRGIDYLQTRGQLNKSPNSGVFVTKKHFRHNGSSERCIAVITPEPGSFTEDEPGIFHSALTVVKDLVLAHNYSLYILQCEREPLSPRAIERLNTQCSGVILMTQYDAWFDDFPLEIPVVGMLMENNFDGRLSIVGLDPFSAARQAVAFFRKNNINRVHVVGAPRPVFEMRRKLFEMFWLESGGEIDGCTAYTPINRAPKVEYREGCGYFFTSDNMLYDCARHHFEETGVSIVDQFTVLAVDGKSLVMPWEISFPTIAVDWKEVGREAFAECMALIEKPNRSPRRVYLPCSFVGRKGTARFSVPGVTSVNSN